MAFTERDTFKKKKAQIAHQDFHSHADLAHIRRSMDFDPFAKERGDFGVLGKGDMCFACGREMIH